MHGASNAKMTSLRPRLKELNDNPYIGILNKLRLKPDVVIVWGCDLGDELKERKFKPDDDGYNWENEGIQFVNSYHPSSGDFNNDKENLKSALNLAFQKVSKVTNG